MKALKEIWESWFRDWARFGKNWILAVPLLVIPAAYGFVTRFVEAEVLISSPYFLAGSGIVILASIGVYAVATNRAPPQDQLIITVAKFNPVTPAARDQADNLRHKLVDSLQRQMSRFGIKGQTISIDQAIKSDEIIQPDSQEGREKLARKLGKHMRSHIIIYGDVRSDEVEFFFRPIVLNLVEQPLRFYPGKEPASKTEIGAELNSPQRLEFREQKASETTSLALFICAMIKFNQGAYAQAIQILQAIAEPSHQTHFYHGYAHFNLSQFDEALEQFEKAISLKPDFGRAWSFKAFAAHELGQEELMREALLRAGALASAKPDDSINADLLVTMEELLRYLALWSETLDWETRQIKEYMEAERQALEPLLAEANRRHAELPEIMAKGDALMHTVKAGLLRTDEDYQAALVEYEHALEKVPDYADALIGKGLVLAILGQQARAREVLAAAEAHSIDGAPNSFQMARAYAILGEADKALEHMQAVVRHNPLYGKWAREHEEFEALKGNEAFDAIIEAARRAEDAETSAGGEV